MTTDTTAPILTGFTSPTAVVGPGETIYMSYTYDDPSGLGYVAFSFEGTNGNWLDLVDYDGDGLIEEPLPYYVVDDSYTLAYATVGDTFGNYAFYDSNGYLYANDVHGSHSFNFSSVALTVEGQASPGTGYDSGTGDNTQPPHLLGFNIAATSFAPGETVSISYSVDDLASLGAASFVFVDSNNNALYLDDTDADGVIEETIPESFAGGSFSLLSATTLGRDHNQIYYSNDGLYYYGTLSESHNLTFSDLSFSVSSGSGPADTVGPIITSMSISTNNIAPGETINISYEAEDSSTISRTSFYFYNDLGEEIILSDDDGDGYIAQQVPLDVSGGSYRLVTINSYDSSFLPASEWGQPYGGNYAYYNNWGDASISGASQTSHSLEFDAFDITVTTTQGPANSEFYTGAWVEVVGSYNFMGGDLWWWSPEHTTVSMSASEIVLEHSQTTWDGRTYTIREVLQGSFDVSAGDFSVASGSLHSYDAFQEWPDTTWSNHYRSITSLDISLEQFRSYDGNVVLNGNDVVLAADSDDRIDGFSGDDYLMGGGGNDRIAGGSGNDVIDGGYGWDTVDYSDAAAGVIVDLINGVAADGDGGQDTLSSIENVVGSSHDDQIRASNYSFINGTEGNDTVVINGLRADFEITAHEGWDGTAAYAVRGISQPYDVWLQQVETILFSDSSIDLGRPLDVSGDGLVTAEDGLLAFAHLSGYDGPGSEELADVGAAIAAEGETLFDIDGNGATNAGDGLLLLLDELDAPDFVLSLFADGTNGTRESGWSISQYVDQQSALAVDFYGW